MSINKIMKNYWKDKEAIELEYKKQLEKLADKYTKVELYEMMFQLFVAYHNLRQGKDDVVFGHLMRADYFVIDLIEMDKDDES